MPDSTGRPAPLTTLTVRGETKPIRLLWSTGMAKPRKVPKERPGPVGGKRDQNRRERTQALLDAGLKLFLARGLEIVTIDEITKSAGVAKGSFYRYFDDKSDLVAGIVDPLAGEVRSAMSQCEEALGKAETAADVNAAYVMLGAQIAMSAGAQKDVLRLYLQEHRAPSVGARERIGKLADEIRHSAIELSEVARQRGLIQVSDPRISATAVVGAVEALGLLVLDGTFSDLDFAQVGPALVNMIMDGIRPRS